MNDSIVRSGRRKSFTVLYNSMITDNRLSLKAKGLFAVMMSRPDDWEFSVSGLAAFTGVGKDSIRNTLAELERVGYLIREQGHNDDGTFAGNVYILQDIAPPLSEKPDNGEMPLLWALRHLRVQTGSLACVGCGYEHNCGIHGCAILNAVVAELERMSGREEDATCR